MKSKFIFNNRRYISPTKKEAKKFLRYHGIKYASVNRLETTWRLKQVELAPTWAQMVPVVIDGVEYQAGMPSDRNQA